MKRTFKYISPLLLMLMSIVGCKKSYLETVPSNGVTKEALFTTFSGISSALQGIYKEQFQYGIGGSTGHDNFGQKALDITADLMGNDMVVHSAGYSWFNRDYNYSEQGVATLGRRSDIAWYLYYDIIKQANNIIKNVDAVANATQAQKEDVKGQALGLRAYAYYNLINWFQQTYKGNESKPGVPIYNEQSTTAELQSGKPRASVQEVYNQIVSDLTLAETLLTGKTQALKSNIDIHVVQGLRARTALIMEDWATAATYANKARQGSTLMNATEYVALSAFSSVSSKEWMWGSIIPADQATIYASFFSHMDIRTGGYAALGGQKKITKALYDQIPAGDVRKTVFRTPASTSTSNPPYNQLKFQVPSTTNKWEADYLYMRASEMYLIEAEALARQGQDAQAQSVLETLVKARNPAYSASGLSGTDLLNEILLQRRIELWGEGFSLFDIKRLKTGLNRPTGTGNHGAPSYDPGVYTMPDADPRFLLRIPQRELDNNLSMTPADQNP
jgi:starch-binding outer membrane protein, SusD/RagB family